MKNSIISNLEKIKTSQKNNMGLLANYLLEYKGDISKLRIQTICDDLFISIASATRLSKELGFSGFNEMKILLEEERKQTDTHLKKYDNVSLEGYTNILTSSLEETIRNIDEDSLNKIAKDIDNSNIIKFYGVGSSYIILKDFAYKIARIKKNIFINSDYHVNYINAINSSKDDLVICFSTTGLTKEILHLLKISKSQGAKTVLFTCNSQQEFIDADTTIVITEIDNFKKTYSISSRISSLAIFDLIFLKVMEIDKKEKQLLLEKTIYNHESNKL